MEPSSKREGVPAIRASDADRDRVVTLLRQHAADGRLTLDELGERITEAYAARTTDDLRPVLRELPPPDRPLPLPTPPARRGLSPAVRTYVLVMALLIGVWAVSGAQSFWPLWPLLGWGFALRSGHCGRARSAGS